MHHTIKTVLVGFILFALAVFAWFKFDLYYKITYQKVPADQARIYAKSLIDYAAQVDQAVHQKLKEGVKETKLCFDTDMYPGGDERFEYDACAKPKNRIYTAEGQEGGVLAYRFPAVADEAFDPAHHTGSSYQRWYVSGNVPVYQQGSLEAELIVSVNYLKREVCAAINDILGIKPKDGQAVPYDETSRPKVYSKFKGVFGGPLDNVIGDEAESLKDRAEGCRKTGKSNHQYYRVILAR